jgi:hypothetical protein
VTTSRTLILNLLAAIVLSPGLCAAAQQPAAHATAHFSFPVAAPLAQAAPLFGPQGERAWSGDDWDPHFLFPAPPSDVEGAVFTIQHGEHQAVWVNTRFDLAGGRMQYVYVLPELLTCTIDVALHPAGASRTEVDITYTRTALSAQANEHVRALSQHDSEQGPEWEHAIAAYLEKHKGQH